MLHQWLVSSFSLELGAILIFQKLFFHNLMGFTFYVFTSHFRGLIGTESSDPGQHHSSYPKMERPAWAATTWWCRTPLSPIPTQLRHSSAQSMAVQQFKWGNTLPQLGKTHQKKTKVRGGKTKQSRRFYYPFSWVLNYSSPSLKWFWNSHEHIDKTEACKRPCPRGTKQNWSENWETSDLLRPTKSGKKWSFDWNVAMLAQSSYLLHWLQY